MGRSVARGDGIPGTKRTPVFPLFLGAIYAIVGINHFVPRVLLCVMMAGICVLTYALGRLTVGDRPARWGALLAAVHPPLFMWSGRLMSEVPFTLFFTGFLCMLSLVQRGGGALWRQKLAGAGVLLGLALLTRPVGSFVIPFLLFWGLASPSNGFRLGRIERPALVLLSAAVVVAPWTLRNYRLTGAFIPLSSNAGTVLIGGNNPVVACSPPSLLGPHHWQSGGLVSPEVSGLLRAEDYAQLFDASQIETDRLYRARALDYIRKNPFDASELAVHKLVRSGDLIPVRRSVQARLALVASYALFISSLCGLWLSRTEWRRIFPLLLALGTILSSVAVTAGVRRFLHPLEPVALLLAGVAIANLTRGDSLGGRAQRRS